MKNVIIFMVLALLCACSGEQVKTPPDEPVSSHTSTQTQTPNPILEPADADDATAPLESPVPAAFEALRAKLSSLGYEGVGLEHETVETIEKLVFVFSDAAAANRRIKVVYTGAANDYDAKIESVTLNGALESQALIAFLKKKVPLKGAAPKASKRRSK